MWYVVSFAPKSDSRATSQSAITYCPVDERVRSSTSTSSTMNSVSRRECMIPLNGSRK